jgi:hypothetical protein
MMRTLMTLMAAAAMGCGGKGDDCQQFVDKAKPMFEKMAKEAGKPFGDSERKQLVEMCRKQGAKAKDDKTFTCVLGAKDEAAVMACFGEGLADYASKSKATEAQLNLNKIGKNLKVAYNVEVRFPAGKAGPAPAKPCCEGPGQKCPAENLEADPVWSALDFRIDLPTRFQYTYESDGKTAKATAIGDLDCDGTTITYTLEATVNNGNPEVKITPPTNAD